MKKRLVTCLMVMVMVFGSVSLCFAAATYTESESNNTRIEAMNKNEFLLEADESFMLLHGVASVYDRNDYYKIQSEKLGGCDIRLYNDDDNMDYDLYLYDQNGGLLGESHNSGSKTEKINNIYISPSKIYYIRVEYRSGNFPMEPYEVFFNVVQ